MFQRIVVPLDGTSLAEAELEYAVGMLLDEESSRLILVMASNHPEAKKLPSNFLTQEDLSCHQDLQITRYLTALLKVLRSRLSLAQLGCYVIHGRPSEVILQTAEQERADLIVIASHGREGLEHFFIRSVTEGLLHDCDIPLLVVRPHLPSRPSPLFRRAAQS